MEVNAGEMLIIKRPSQLSIKRVKRWRGRQMRQGEMSPQKT